MKTEKNKIIFFLVLVTVLLFLGGYYAMTFGDGEENKVDKGQIPVPELVDEQKQYGSKLEALDAIKEEREKTAPSLYPEHMVDEKGYFNPEYMEYEKQRIIDSIYLEGEQRYSAKQHRHIGRESPETEAIAEMERDTLDEILEKEIEVDAKERALEHQLFFASYPTENADLQMKTTDTIILVYVDGTQTVRKDYRLKMRLTENAIIDGRKYPRNTPIYGFVSFKPNRAIIAITNIRHRPVNLTAHDLQDGKEGIYVMNSFKSEASQEVIGDMVDAINIPGTPDIAGTINTGAKGIKKVFKKDHRSVKVTILDDFRLILKLPKPTPSQIFGNPISKLE